MPVYEITIFKHSSLYTGDASDWSNVYHAILADLDSAGLCADAIAGQEIPLYGDTVTITHAYIKALDGAGSAVHAIGDVGSRTSLSNILPPWNVARVDWTVTGRPRTARKYLRMTMQEGDVSDRQFIPDVISVLQEYGDNVADIPGIVGSLGEPLIGPAVVDHFVAMRQVGWSRRARPGFHRGYVANP